MGFFDVESGPSATFKNYGDSVTGTITKPYSERQATEFSTDKPKVNDAGQPVMMAVVELQTTERDPSIFGDTGIRIVYIEKFGQKVAVGDAIKAAGAPDLEVGGTLTITYTGETPSQKGNPLKTWSATYVRPVGLLGGAANKPAVTTTTNPTPQPDLVALARAAQEKAAADQAALVARTAAATPPPPAGQVNTNGNGAPDAAADMLKIRELHGLGFDAASIHAAMPHRGLDVINAVLAV